MGEQLNLNGFKPLQIRYDVNCSNGHQLFFKEHSVRNQEAEYPREQTLFVLNVPPYVTPESLKYGFGALCGDVQSVTLSKPKGFKTAYVVFKNESSLDKAMELPANCVITLTSRKNATCQTGLKKWCKEYNNQISTNEETLKREIEEYIAAYDKNLQDCLEREKEEEKDSEGWVTVTGKKKRGQFAPTRKESTINKVQQKEVYKKKKQLINFYTFQIREAKKQNLAELRKKFELDKKKVQEMKQRRTFKPF